MTKQAVNGKPLPAAGQKSKIQTTDRKLGVLSSCEI